MQIIRLVWTAACLWVARVDLILQNKITYSKNTIDFFQNFKSFLQIFFTQMGKFWVAVLRIEYCFETTDTLICHSYKLIMIIFCNTTPKTHVNI